MLKISRLLLVPFISLTISACGSDNNDDDDNQTTTTNTPSSTPAPGNPDLWRSATVRDTTLSVINEDPVTTPDENCKYKHVFEAQITGEFRVSVNCEYEWTGRVTDDERERLKAALSQISVEEAASDLECRDRGDDGLLRFNVKAKNTNRNYVLFNSENEASDRTCWSGNLGEVQNALDLLDQLRTTYNSPTMTADR